MAGRLAAAGRTAVRPTTAEAENPFALRADEDVFRIRERERQKQEEVRCCCRRGRVTRHYPSLSQFLQLRAAQAGKKIWEKTDYTSTLGRTRKAMEELAPDVDPAALRKAKESKGLITAATVRARLRACRCIHPGVLLGVCCLARRCWPYINCPAPLRTGCNSARSSTREGEHGRLRREEARDVSPSDVPRHKARGDRQARAEGVAEGGGAQEERADA